MRHKYIQVQTQMQMKNTGTKTNTQNKLKARSVSIHIKHLHVHIQKYTYMYIYIYPCIHTNIHRIYIHTHMTRRHAMPTSCEWCNPQAPCGRSQWPPSSMEGALPTASRPPTLYAASRPLCQLFGQSSCI